MRIIFDQGTPVPIRRYLVGHDVKTAFQQGWDQLRNGDLLLAAEAAGFDILLTTDKNLSYQQNLSSRRIAVVLLTKQQWPELKPHIVHIIEAVNAIEAAGYTEINIP